MGGVSELPLVAMLGFKVARGLKEGGAQLTKQKPIYMCKELWVCKKQNKTKKPLCILFVSSPGFFFFLDEQMRAQNRI